MAETTAEPVRVATTVAMKGVLDEFAPAFRRETGRRLAMTFGPGGVTLARVRAGHACDVVISAPATLNTLAQEGFLAPGTIALLSRSVVGVAVRAGAPHPRIDTEAHFRQALLDAKAVAYTNPATGAASGVHFIKVLERLGIAEAVNAHAKLGDGGPVAEFVARGEAELAIQQVCEHMLVKGVEVVGPVPEALQTVTTLAVALHSRAAARQAGEALIRLLTSAAVQARLPAHGLEPAA